MRLLNASLLIFISVCWPAYGGSIVIFSQPKVIQWNLAASQTLPNWISFSRSTVGTDGLISDAAGSSYNTYSANVPIYYGGLGLGNWPARTNFLLNSAVPVTQTTASLSTGTYQFWCIGSGSVTSSLGTATATGTGALTCSTGSPQAIVVTVSGTLTFTVSGSVDRFQLELGAYPTPFIVTAGATFARTADNPLLVGTSSIDSKRNVGTIVVEATGAPTTAARGATTINIIGCSSAQPIILNANDKVASFNASATITTGVAKPFSSLQRAGLSWIPNFRSVTAGGQTAASDTNVTGFSLANCSFGSSNSGAGNLGGYITKIAIYPNGLPNNVFVNETNAGIAF